MALTWIEWLFSIPVIGGSVYGVLCVVGFLRLRRSGTPPPAAEPGLAPVTVLKPVYGLEKGLRENLRSACLQDYPEYQVVLSVQDPKDPALPLLREVEAEYGPGRVTVAVDESQSAPNGKIRNLLGALPHARHDLLVISDSDVRVPPDYLRTIVAPLADPQVGCACTLYRAAGAERWFEWMEQITFNADFMASVVFAHASGASEFCLGASTAIRRADLEAIGGLQALGDYLVEDYEMGRRILAAGKKIAIVPVFVDTMVDLKTPAAWWKHQVYWDQNTRAARPVGFFGTVLVRSIPFALLVAALRLMDRVGLGLLAGAVIVRLATAAMVLGWGVRDRESLKSLWLLPLRDLAGMVFWASAFLKRRVVWRGTEFDLTAGGRLVPLEGKP